MDDLISRQTILKWIDECLNHSDKLWEYEEKALISVKQFIKHLPTIKSESKWIPCNERLPDTDDAVLITNNHGVTKAWWNGRFWSSITVKKYKTVTAWMPLPKPYKGEHDG